MLSAKEAIGLQINKTYQHNAFVWCKKNNVSAYVWWVIKVVYAFLTLLKVTKGKKLMFVTFDGCDKD